MRKILIIVVCVAFAFGLRAQTVRDDIRQNIRYSASNYLAYPFPKQHHLSPAPKGKEPFYISHYGRHGSRYHNKPETYDIPYHVLDEADKAGKLTPLGQDVLYRLDVIRRDAHNLYGQLTDLGAQQEYDIMRRMVGHFPEVFTDSVFVDARSTMVTRCVLSMEHALLELSRRVPTIQVIHHATERDMYYLNLQDEYLFSKKMDSISNVRYKEFTSRYENHDRLMQILFNDTAYVHRHVDMGQLNYYLFKVASNIQSTDIRKNITLYDIFTDEEAYINWKKENAWWYICFGGSTLNGGSQPYTQRNLLRRIIEEADSCLRLPHPGVQLRFGHETVLLPLVCLMDINGYGLAADDLESLDRRGWVNYRVYPMGGNLQLVFYRASPDDKDVLLKVLLNENEARLPLESVESVYYRWNDFRDFYLKKLDAYVEQ